MFTAYQGGLNSNDVHICSTSASKLLLDNNWIALFARRYVSAGPHRPKQSIPERKAWLAEILLYAPILVVHVVVGGIVAGQVLEWIPGECVSAVVVDRLDGQAGEEPHSLSDRHAGRQVGDGGAERFEKESFDRVVVEGAKSVCDVESVMSRV
jgi:hypothetical protein